MAETEPLARQLHEMAGPLAADCWAVTLAAAGRVSEARAVYDGRVPMRHDFFHSVFATMRGMAAIALGDREEAEALVADLAPTPELAAGAASASLALQPVAQTWASSARSWAGRTRRPGTLP